MQISDLKKSLFGYSRESVYQYISSMNEEFSRKLLEKERNTDELLKELQARNQALEKQIEELRCENDEYRKMHLAVSDSIIDAQNYAQQMKAETKQREQIQRAKIAEKIRGEQVKLAEYIGEIDGFREKLRDILADIDGTLEKSKNQAEKLSAFPIEQVCRMDENCRSDGRARNESACQEENDVHAEDRIRQQETSEERIRLPEGKKAANMSLFRRKDSTW